MKDPAFDFDAPEPPDLLALHDRAVAREHRVRQLILDYAIGVSILGLIPIPGILAVKFIGAGLLILKMLREIGREWGFPGRQDAFAIVGNLFGAIGAMAMALMAWATLFAIGVVVPWLRGLGIAAALFTLTWALGQATYQFYASSPEPDHALPPFPSRNRPRHRLRHRR